MTPLCGLCAIYHNIDQDKTKYFFTQAKEETNSAVFKACFNNELVHQNFLGCDKFVPSKTMFCARYQKMVTTESCLGRQLGEIDEACLDCIQGEMVIDVMRGVRWSELK